MNRRTQLCTAMLATALLAGAGAVWAGEADPYMSLPVAEVTFPGPPRQALCDDMGGAAGHVAFDYVIEEPELTVRSRKGLSSFLDTCSVRVRRGQQGVEDVAPCVARPRTAANTGLLNTTAAVPPVSVTADLAICLTLFDTSGLLNPLTVVPVDGSLRIEGESNRIVVRGGFNGETGFEPVKLSFSIGRGHGSKPVIRFDGLFLVDVLEKPLERSLGEHKLNVWSSGPMRVVRVDHETAEATPETAEPLE